MAKSRKVYKTIARKISQSKSNEGVVCKRLEGTGNDDPEIWLVAWISGRFNGVNQDRIDSGSSTRLFVAFSMFDCRIWECNPLEVHSSAEKGSVDAVSTKGPLDWNTQFWIEDPVAANSGIPYGRDCDYDYIDIKATERGRESIVSRFKSARPADSTILRIRFDIT